MTKFVSDRPPSSTPSTIHLSMIREHAEVRNQQAACPSSAAQRVPSACFCLSAGVSCGPRLYGPRNNWHRLRSKSSMERTETKQCAAWPFSHSSSERRSHGPARLWSKAKCLVPVLNWLACVAMIPNLCPRSSVPIILDAPRFITLDAHS